MNTEKKIIQIIGKGCKKCAKLYENTVEAVISLGKDEEYEIVKFEDVEKFADLDVFITPALRVNGKVVSEGRVLGIDKLREHL